MECSSTVFFFVLFIYFF